MSGRRFDFHEKASGQYRVIERDKLEPAGRRGQDTRHDPLNQRKHPLQNCSKADEYNEQL